MRYVIAKLKDFWELKNSRMRVSEANSLTTNKFLSNKKLITPNSRSALHGMTRKSILEISKDLGIKAYEKKVTLNEVRNADEVFFCGTATEVAPIVSIDGKKIGNGKIGEITSRVRDKYYNVVRGKDKKYEKWLTFID